MNAQTKIHLGYSFPDTKTCTEFPETASIIFRDPAATFSINTRNLKNIPKKYRIICQLYPIRGRANIRGCLPI